MLNLKQKRAVWRLYWRYGLWIDVAIVVVLLVAVVAFGVWYALNVVWY